MSDTRLEYEAEHGTAAYWEIELSFADKAEKEWREAGKEVIDRYKAEKSLSAIGREKKFNILWSNTETLKGALFARMAKPDVRRRYLDRDTAGRQVALILERGLEYSSDIYDEQTQIAAVVEDSILPGRGVAWVVYEPVVVGDGDDERVGDQRCQIEYVGWEDYRESPAKRPEDVRWKARRHLWTRDELDARGFDDGDIPLNWTPTVEDGSEMGDAFKRAEVWEIWDKVKSKQIYFVKGYHELLSEEDDPYKLETFFPTPTCPLTAVRTNDSNVPVPEFHLYRDQADELDRVTTRINRLVEALRRRGVYDAAAPELARLAQAGDNEFIPSENFQSLTASGGLNNAFQTEDITVIAQAIMGLYQQRDQLVQTIYEVTGISDIIRGATNPNETATAQKLKGQFGSMRLKRRQDAVQNYIRDLFRIKAEIMAEHYEPEVLERMTGIKMPAEADIRAAQQQIQMMGQQAQQTGQPAPETPKELKELAETPSREAIMAIMRDDKLRSYRVDIETDSTVFEDAEGEKNARIEFVNTLGAFVEKGVAVASAQPALVPLVFHALEFMIRGFKVGREFEDVVEEAKENILAAAKEAQENPQPDPEQEKMKAEMDLAQKAAETERLKIGFEQENKEKDRLAAQQQQAIDAQRFEFEKEDRTAQRILDGEKMRLEREKLEDGKVARREGRNHEMRQAGQLGEMDEDMLAEEMKEMMEQLAEVMAQSARTSAEASAAIAQAAEAIAASATVPKQAVKQPDGSWQMGPVYQ